MPRGGRKNERHSRSPRSASETRVKRPHKKEKQQEKEKELRRFEKEKQRAESGKKGAMRAFSATQSDSDSDAMTDDDLQDLGAAAPAARAPTRNDKYLEEQKQKTEKAKAHAKEREEKRKRTDDQVQEISEEGEIDLEKYKDYRTWEDMTPEDFHKVMLQQSREIKELKQDRQTK